MLLASPIVVFALAASPDVTERLASARAALDDLAYERALAIVASLPDDLAPQQRFEALMIEAYALALTNRSEEAQSAFQRAVREAELDREPPFAMEPHIYRMFESERVQERERRARVAAQVRAELRASIELTLLAPTAAGKRVGGERVEFIVAVADPRGAVQSVRLDFKSSADPMFSSLQMRKRSDGAWRAVIPGTYTRNRDGLDIAWAILAADDQGELASLGTPSAPRVLHIEAGLDVARDLKASERLPAGWRLAYALTSTPIWSGSLFLAGMVPGMILGTMEPVPKDWYLVVPSWIADAFLPPLGALLGTYLANQYLHDPPGLLLVTLVTASMTSIYTGVIAALYFFDGDNFRLVPETPLFSDNFLAPIIAAGSGLFIASVAGVTAATFVVLDPPAEE